MTAQAPLLKPVRLKIEWAEKEIETFAELVEEYVSSKPYSISRKVDGDGRRFVDTLIFDRPPPDEWEITIGTIAGQMRGALDKLAGAMAIQSGATNANGVGFPFNGDGQPFPSDRDKRKVQKLSPKMQDFIFAQKPYKGGDFRLWSINKLANADKHAGSMISVGAGHEVAQTIGPPPGVTSAGYHFTDIPLRLDGTRRIWDGTDNGIELATGPSDLPFKIEHNITLGILFGEIEGVHKYKIVPTLRKMSAIVSRITTEADENFF